MTSREFPTEGARWVMNLVYNKCERRPIQSCNMKGSDDEGNEWDHDCTE